ncbi:MAG: hypothetical protein ACR2F1_00395 [Nitrososphaeraceae archaeon]
MKQTLKLLLEFTIIGTLILFVVATTTNINKSYSQSSQSEELKKRTEALHNCVAENYLVNQTNIKIIDVFLVETINEVCIDDVNQLLEKDYTIKGTLLDKYIILEKIK